ncbi:hypothetical protein ACODUM_03305 [Stenotrophomonas maltophilia]
MNASFLLMLATSVLPPSSEAMESGRRLKAEVDREFAEASVWDYVFSAMDRCDESILAPKSSSESINEHGSHASDANFENAARSVGSYPDLQGALNEIRSLEVECSINPSFSVHERLFRRSQIFFDGLP